MGDTTNNNQKRLIYLAEKFEVFLDDEAKKLLSEYEDNDLINIYPIKNSKGVILALKWAYLPDETRKRVQIKVTISETLFASMLIADPTENKIFLQWMLNSFVRLIKEDDNIKEAIRFGDEDLEVANIYLTLFEANKRKKRFKEWAIKNEYRKWKIYNNKATKADWDALKYDPSDINQYRSLGQLFDAVDPFVEREPSNLERAMMHFVNIGEAEVPFKDRKWTVFIPLTTDANVVFDSFASWCTAKPQNSMFESYTTNYRLPNGEPSKIYIIINNKLFTGESRECYQIHFESGQIKDQSNGYRQIDLYEAVLSTSEGVREYFHSELDKAVRMSKGDISQNNRYINYLISFGYTESLFDYIDEDIAVIKITDRVVPRLPDISRFKNLDELLLIGVKLEELHPSIGSLTNLELLSLPKNKITKIPREIGNLKKLSFINLRGNPISEIPDEITGLDESNGGQLFRLAIDKELIGEANYEKLKRLLPNVGIASN